MPYSIHRRGSRFCVVKDGDGAVMGCHGTRGGAVAQRAALYANEAEAEEVDPRLALARLLDALVSSRVAPWSGNTPT